MAWIYLAESEGSHSPWNHGSDQLPTVRTTDTLNLCCFHAWQGRTCPLLPFGTTCGHFDASLLASSVQKLFTEDFPAKISVLQELARVWRGSEADLCLNSLGSFASADLVSFSWKTSQLSLFGGLTEFFWSSLRWGLMRDGQLFQPQRWEPRISENESGSWPTPCAMDYCSPGMSRQRKAKIEQNRGIPLSIEFKHRFGKNLHPTFVEWMMGYPLKHTVLEDWAMQWYRKQRGKHL